jgi:hypothetical protein
MAMEAVVESTVAETQVGEELSAPRSVTALEVE